MKKFLNLPLIITAFIAGPVIVTFIIAVSLMTSENFHLKIIRGINPIKTFISARNSRLESSIRKEIEEKTGISALREKTEKAKGEYESALKKYREANRSPEYEKYKKQIDELKDLKWAENSGMFKTGKSFDKFRETKIEEMKKKIDSIEQYRDKNEDKIDKLKDIAKDKKEIHEDLADDLADKIEDAEDISKSRHSELGNSLVSDISKVEERLTVSFNSLFLDVEGRRLIKKYIDFVSARDRQIEAGNIYTERLDVSSGMFLNRRVIKIPGSTVNLYIQEKNKNAGEKKHLLGDVFSGVIDSTEGLKNPWILKRIFNLSNSWLGETFGNRFIKRTGMRLEDGNIKISPVIVKGKAAEAADSAIRIMSIGRKYLFLFPALLIIIYSLIIITGKTVLSGINAAGRTMKYSFMIAFIAMFGIALLSIAPGLVMNIPVEDAVIQLIAEKAVSTILVYTMVPMSAAAFVLSVTGSIMVRISRKVKRKEVQKGEII